MCYDELKYDLAYPIKEILLFIKKKKIIEEKIKFFITYENELNAVVKKVDDFFVIEISKIFLEELCLQLTTLTEVIKINITMDRAFDKIEKLVLLNKDIYDIELMDSSVEFTKIVEEYGKFVDRNREVLK